MKRLEALWPRKIVHDSAYVFVPFAFAVFLILLGSTLLVTWGRLSNAVLVGFCVTAGILIGFFIICHLALYCTSVEQKARDPEDKEGSGSSLHGSVLDARSVKLGSPRACRSCLSGLSVHVPAVATFGVTTGKLEPVIEEAHDEGEPVRPARAEQRPPETGLATRNERHVRQTALSSARQIRQASQDRTEDELQTRFSRPMSHLSATVPPLNLGQHHSNSASGFYAFQNPASPHPDSRGGPGILIHSLPEHVTRPGLVAHPVSSPVVLDNTPVGNSTPPPRPQPERQPRTDAHLQISRLDIVTPAQDKNLPPRTPPPRTALRARQQAQQAAPRIGSPLRQSHQYVPYSPRDVGSPCSNRRRPHGPRESEQLSRLPTGDTSQRRAEFGAATSEHTQRVLSDLHNHAQGTTWEPRLPSFETHVVRFREPDLAGLIASGIIKVNPESHPPEWMLKYAPGLSSHQSDLEIHDNAERKKVVWRRSMNLIRRNRSRKAEVEKVEYASGQRYFSTDSGYGTASSGVLSTNQFGKMSTKREEENPHCKRPAAMPSWEWESTASPEGGTRTLRTLRRRSSVPELSGECSAERDDDVGAHDGGSQDSLRHEHMLDRAGQQEMVARGKKTARRVDRSQLSSVNSSEAGQSFY